MVLSIIITGALSSLYPCPGYLVDVDSEAGGREEQQSLQALGPRHQPTWARTQSRTRLTTICTGEIFLHGNHSAVENHNMREEFKY